MRGSLGRGHEIPDDGVRIVPEPAPAERAAILLALEALDGQAAARGAWWSAGLREAIDDDGRSAPHC